MIGVYKEVIKDIPVLIVSKVDKFDEKLPTLIYYHGFRSGKENNLTIGYLLAEKGYRIILPECIHHGERQGSISDYERDLAFWEIVIHTVSEINEIKGYLDKKQLILDNRIGIAGTSMGGMITAAALTTYPWIKVGGLLMSSAKLESYAEQLISHFNKVNEDRISDDQKEQVKEELKQYDLFEHIDKLNDRPLLIWHGKQDDIVPFSHAEDLYNKIEKSSHAADRIHFVPEENRGHHLSRLAIDETIRYFSRYL